MTSKIAPLAIVAGCLGVATAAFGALPRSAATFSDLTTAAATGYCLAKHPYQTIHPGPFTPDGYEVAAAPGIVGAVRRNFVYERSTLSFDEGQKNSCAQACAEFGKAYGPTAKGLSLKQLVSTGGRTQSSGLGDIASLAMPDRDGYLLKDVIAGIWSRSTTWHESDVAQADLCCCHVKV